MKKFILTLVIAFMMIFTANAQIATENAKLFDNVYAGVEAGVTTPFNFNSVFPLNPVVGVKIGKELTPTFAFELEGLAVFGDNVYRYGVNNSMLVPIDGAMNVHKNGSVNTFVKATNVGLNGVINLSNLVFGYKGAPRVFEVKTNAGFGWLHYYGDFTTNIVGGYVPAGKSNVLTAKTGVDLAFNIGRTKAHTFTISPAIYWGLNEEGNIKFNKTYSQLAIMAGYTYHFKTSNGTRYFKTYDVGAMIDEIDRLNEELAKKPTEVIVEKEVTKEVEKIVPVKMTDVYVFFAQNSSTLDDRAKDQLDKLGQNGVYKVVAYASADGTAEYNQRLSERRAAIVADYLINRGCKVDSWEGKGVEYGETTGRVAVVTYK